MFVLRNRSTILRFALAAAAAAAAVFAASPVHGQPVQAPELPRVDVVVPAPAFAPAADPPSPVGVLGGLSTPAKGSDPDRSQASMATVTASTQGCAGSSNAESKLGLMKNTGMYAHCDYP